MWHSLPNWCVDLLQNLLFVVQGLPTSILLTLGSFLIAFTFAIGLTIILYTSTSKLLCGIVNLYITLFTGTPLLMQLFLIYYGLPQFTYLQHFSLVWSLLSQPWFCALLALSFNSAAYSTLLFSGAIKAIPSGQWHACAALGLSRWQSTRLMLSYGLRRAIPAYSNEVILIFKSTSLASTITLLDIMGYAQQLFAQSYEMTAFIAAGVIYLIINGSFTFLFRYLENACLSFEKKYA